MSDAKPPFLRRVVIDNYKSIKHCDVTLGPLTFLLGPNGSGKSNFLEAIGFVADLLTTNLDQSLRDRGGMDQVRHRAPGAEEPNVRVLLLGVLSRGQEFGFRYEWGQPLEETCTTLGTELCWISENGADDHSYLVQSRGKVEGRHVMQASFDPRPPVASDRLYLSAASSFPEFSVLYNQLAGMKFYSVNPGAIRHDQFSLGGDAVLKDGAGTLGVLQRIFSAGGWEKERIIEYMRAILPSLDRLAIESLLDYAKRAQPEAASFLERARAGGEPHSLSFVLRANDHPLHFSHHQMSDGTLRALGVLTALFQCKDRPPQRPIPLVGIEEPEATLHPAAAGVLTDALREASHWTQVIVSSHSPDLLDSKDLDPDSLLIFDMKGSETVVGPADEASKSILRQRLCTAGELLRQNQLEPDLRTPEPAPTDSPPPGSMDSQGKS